MKQNRYAKRPGNRPNRPPGGKGGGNPLNRVFESNGPDVKLRGTAAQVHEKYVGLARDAQSSGDRVAAEGYFQHAEHYQRMLTSMYEHRDRDNTARQSHGNEAEKDGSAETERQGIGGRYGEMPPPRRSKPGDQAASPPLDQGGHGW